METPSVDTTQAAAAQTTEQIVPADAPAPTPAPTVPSDLDLQKIDATDMGTSALQSTWQSIVSVATHPTELLSPTTLTTLGILFGVGIATYVVLRIVRGQVLKRLHALVPNTANPVDDQVVSLFEAIPRSWYIGASVYAALTSAGILGPLSKLILVGIVAWALLVVVKMLQVFVDYYHGGFVAKTKEENAKILANTARQATKTALWAVAGFTVLSLAGVNVGALIAGFGVIGVTLGLASQNIAGDIFKAILLRFNSPFKTGDRIQLPNVSGTIEELTLFTTRLKGDDGAAVVLKNAEIPFDKLKNLGPRGNAQHAISFVLPFNTPQEKIATAVSIAEHACVRASGAVFTDAVVKGITPTGLQCEVSFSVPPEKTGDMRTITHAVLVALVDGLTKAGIEFKA